MRYSNFVLYAQSALRPIPPQYPRYLYQPHHIPTRHFRLGSPSTSQSPPDSDDGNESSSATVLIVPPPPTLFALAAPCLQPKVPLQPPLPNAEELSTSSTHDGVDVQSGRSAGSAAACNTPLSDSLSSAPPPSASSSASFSSFSISSLSNRVSETCRKRVQQWRESIQNHTREFALNTAKNLTLLSLKVNEVTGYREVERLKVAVKEREHDLGVKRVEAKTAKSEYEHAVMTRSTSQQNVNALLERKHSWTDNDVAEFTKLVRSDHASRHAVSTTSQDLKQAELAVDKAFTALMQSILERYHEEQVWSDKIRSVSTWANIVALAANLIVFVGAIAFVEPWKRRRLVQGLEERMTGMMNRVDEELQTLSANVAKLEPAAPSTVMGTSELAQPPRLQQTGLVAMPLDSEAAPDTQLDVTPTTAPLEHTLSTSGSEVGNDGLSSAPHDEQFTDKSFVSPIQQLALEAVPSSRQSRVLGWLSEQLSYVGTPSIERDLAAAGLVGAVGGAVTIGIVDLMVRFLRG